MNNNKSVRGETPPNATSGASRNASSGAFGGFPPKGGNPETPPVAPPTGWTAAELAAGHSRHDRPTRPVERTRRAWRPWAVDQLEAADALTAEQAAALRRLRDAAEAQAAPARAGVDHIDRIGVPRGSGGEGGRYLPSPTRQDGQGAALFVQAALGADAVLMALYARLIAFPSPSLEDLHALNRKASGSTLRKRIAAIASAAVLYWQQYDASITAAATNRLDRGVG